MEPMERRYSIRKPEGVSFSIDYEKELNTEQLQVVMAPIGPLLVLAGAGSGKTRALVFRLARLIELDVPPAHIRLLTFTNRAARSMLERVGSLCGGLAQDVVGGTFHSVALKDLQRFADKLGYTPQFTVMGRDDVKELMGLIRSEETDEAARERLPSSEIILEMISLSLNTQTPIDQVILEKFRRFYEMSVEIAAMARKFFERKHAMNVMDFDDLLANWYALLREHDDVSLQLQSEIKAVLVDEYQDTNKLQCEIVKLLAKGCNNVTVVGDDAQSIYAFRGANVRNILDFSKAYPNALSLNLLTNYRSTPQILKLANESRRFAQEGFQKNLLAIRVEGERPAIVSCTNVNMQANFVAQRIQELRSEGVSLDEIAVLYRAHHHAMEIQLELMRRQIPFVVRSGLRFFEQAHIKDVLSYVRFAYNPKDEINFRRAARLHEGIGPHIAQKLWQTISKNPLESVLQCREVLAGVNLGTKASLGLKSFLEMLDVFKQTQPSAVLLQLFKTHYESYVMGQFANAQQRCDDIRQLAAYANSFKSMDKFISDLMLLSEFGVEELPADPLEREKSAKVTLSSVHQAKGLEWSHVFVVWLAEGRFPSELALRESNGLEEERRLFYVAATRAKDSLYFVHPSVARQSDWRQIMLRRSRFIEEITSLKKCEEILADNWVVEDEIVHENLLAFS